MRNVALIIDVTLLLLLFLRISTLPERGRMTESLCTPHSLAEIFVLDFRQVA